MSLNAVLVRRLGRTGAPSPAPVSVSDADLRLEERRLLRLGAALHVELRSALSLASKEDVAAWVVEVGTALSAGVGAGVTHAALLPSRMATPVVSSDVAARLGGSGVPCTMCEKSEDVSILVGCLHFACVEHLAGVCAACGSTVEESALVPAAKSTATLASGVALRSLHLSADPAADAALVVEGLLSRVTPLSEVDQDDLAALLGVLPGTAWVPERIPVRESSAVVAVHLLRTQPLEDVRETVLRLWVSATDILRTVQGLAEGDVSLSAHVRVPQLRRPVRRLVLEALDAMSVEHALEAVLKHERAWKRLAERLHPFEDAQRYPSAATIFAALRNADLGSSLSKVVTPVVDERRDVLAVESGRVVFSSWTSRVETMLLAGEVREATRLLAQRPGELVRRLNHLLTVMVRFEVDGLDGICKVVREVGASAGAGAVLSALGELSSRTTVSPERVFLAKDPVHVKSVPDERIPLPETIVDEVCSALSAVLVERFEASGDHSDLVVLDEALKDVIVPTSERSASRSLVSIPRGSLLALPDGQDVRLYLHWMQPEGNRVDLDLSVAMFDDDWNFVGVCDYTRTDYKGVAQHSGDLTSAPAPLGASEFVDLDVAGLLDKGVRRLAMVVYSFNDVPFEELPRAFAGVMLPSKSGQFDPRAVVQRFDLAGDTRSIVPMIVDLVDRQARWLDVPLGSQGSFHSVAGSLAPLTRVVKDLDSYYAAGRRLSVFEVAALYAAGTAEEVVVRRRDGGLVKVERNGVGRDEFTGRVLTVDGVSVEVVDESVPHVRVVMEADAAPEGSTVVSLWGTAPPGVTAWGFSDLLARLG